MTEGAGRVLVDAITEDPLAIDASGRAAIQNPPNMDAAASTLATQATLALILTRLTAIEQTAGIKKITDQLPAGTNNIGDVDVASSALPAGAATQTTLAAILTRITAIEQTAGIKKITDPLPAGTNNIGNVDVASSALPTGAATSANQTTVIGHVDGIESSLSSIDGKDFATQTTLAAVLAKLDITVSALRDAIVGVGPKTLTDVETTLDAIKDTDGVKKITDALPTGDNWIGKTKLGDGTNTVDIAEEGEVAASTFYSQMPMGVDESHKARHLHFLTDEDETGLFRLATSGKVSITVAPPPEGGTRVSYYADNPLEINNSISPHLTEYDIPDGDTLHIQQIVAGCQGDPSADGSKCEVYYWDGTDEHLIDRIYIVGQTQFGNYPDTSAARDGEPLLGMTASGDGAIRIYRSRLSNSSQEIDAIVRGYTI